MKNIILAFILLIAIVACEQTVETVNINVEGYWQVKDKNYVDTATADLYHLFKGESPFYRFSFLKNTDFANPATLPRKDSLIAYYQTRGDMLMLSSQGPGFNLIYQDDSQMKFSQTKITKRDGVTGEVLTTKTDTVLYLLVTDPVKISYFDNLLKKWHPVN
jgi:hypothetical protein